MTDPRAEALNRQGLHCAGAACLSTLVALAAWGLVTPWTLVWAQPLDLPMDLGFGILELEAVDLAVMLAIAFAAALAGWYAWALVVQRRRPWPLGPWNQNGRMVARWPLRTLPYVLGYTAAFALNGPLRDAFGLSFTPIDGYWIVLSAPADAAIFGIISISVYVIVDVTAYLVVNAMLRQWDPNVPPTRLIPRSDNASQG